MKQKRAKEGKKSLQPQASNRRSPDVYHKTFIPYQGHLCFTGQYINKLEIKIRWSLNDVFTAAARTRLLKL